MFNRNVNLLTCLMAVRTYRRSTIASRYMKRTTLNWLRGAEYDIKTAESLLRGRRYVYVIFMCHLAVEKTLKAIVAETSTTPPPRTHNLYRLLELGRIQLPEVHETIVAQLNTMSTATRIQRISLPSKQR